MEDKKDSKFLYFDNEEIEKEKTDNKQIFVTKRLGGKETHNIKKQIKADHRKKNEDIKRKEENILGNNELIIDIPISQNNIETPKRKIQNKGNTNQRKNGKSSKNSNDNKRSKNNANSKNSKNNVNNKNSKKYINNKNNKRNKNNINVNRKNTKKEIVNKKSKNKRKVVSKIILLIILIVSIAICAFITPIFDITEINVKGNNILTYNTIVSISGINKGENIFKNRKSSIKKNLKENAYIEDAKIKRKLPGTIEIDIKERTIEYQINVMESLVYIDRQGYILEKSKSQTDAIFIEGYETKDEDILKSKRLNNNDLIKLSSVQKIINAYNSAEITEKIEKVDISNSKEYVLYINNKQIYLGDDSNLSNKMGYIKKILEDVNDSKGIIFVNRESASGLKAYFRPEE